MTRNSKYIERYESNSHKSEIILEWCLLKGIYNSRTEALERKRNEKKIVKSSNRDNSPRLQDTAGAKVIYHLSCDDKLV